MKPADALPTHSRRLKILSLVIPDLRTIRPMIPHYVKPVRYDTTKLRNLLGEVETTTFEAAIPRTLDWILGSGRT